MRWKMERMVSTVKVPWLQEAQFAVSLIVRFEVLFSDVTVTLFLGIKIKLVLSLECFGISQGETCSPALSSRNPVELLQNISGYSLWERCCCLSVSLSAQVMKTAGAKKVLDPVLLVLHKCFCIAQQAEYIVQTVVCFKWSEHFKYVSHFRLMCFWWIYVLGSISHNAPKLFTNKRGWKLFTCKWVTINLPKVDRVATFQYISI